MAANLEIKEMSSRAGRSITIPYQYIGGGASPLPSWGPKRGRKCNVTPVFSGVPNAKRGTKSEVAASPMPSQRPKRGRKCYVTLAFSGVPNKGDKIRSGCLTLAFSGAQKRAELLRNPYVPGGPQQRGQNRKSKPILGATMMPLVSQSMGL